MYNPETDLIFPPRAIPALAHERGVKWQELVSAAQASGAESTAQVAFILMLARLNNCATCNADSYRAIHGCTACTRQSLKRFHGTDEDLSLLFDEAKDEVLAYLNSKSKSEKNI